MERTYKAFISYRHLPLEIETAKKLHRRIEHYTVPADLRRDGAKKLGYVFRDQDELPISSDLSANIRQALDRSEFLIVICSPETAKSAWVLGEIRYFLEHHDRDHVLAVLVDGVPDTAFPPELVELRSDEGGVLERVEPMAANMVADTPAARARLFRVESLRILAALIGCPFDALYRREQRYRRRRAGIAVGAAGLIAAAFIGMLLNRNAQIRAQLNNSLINESVSLAALSENAYQAGDYSGALQYAQQALPREGAERPYVAAAEFALSQELDLYRTGVLSYAQSFEQETPVRLLDLSLDGVRLATADGYGALRFFDTADGSLLWQVQTGGVSRLAILEEHAAVLSGSTAGTELYSAFDGAPLWRREDVNGLDLAALSEDHSLLLAASFLAEPYGGPEELRLLDAATGETLRTIRVSEGPSRFCPTAVFSPDNARAAFLLQDRDVLGASLFVAELSTGELREIARDLPYSIGAVDYQLCFSPEGDLLVACDDMNGASAVRCYDPGQDWALRWSAPIETEKVAQAVNSSVSLYAALDLLDCRGGRVVVGSKHFLYLLDEGSGEVLWQKTLPAYLLCGRMYENACLSLAFSNGTVCFCTEDGVLSYTQNVYCFKGRFEVDLAAAVGDSFPDSTFALIPDDAQGRAVILRFLENEAMVPAAERPADGRMSLLSSPSGARQAWVAYDYAGRPYLAGPVEEGGASFPLPEEGRWDRPDALFLTDDGLLISQGFALDLRSGEGTPLCAGDGAVLSALSPARGCILSACLERGEEGPVLRVWRDGREAESVPCPPEASELLALGGNGLALLRAEGAETCLALSLDGGDLPDAALPLSALQGGLSALAEEKPLLALRGGDGLLELRDLKAGTSRSGERLPTAAVSLRFACGDRVLLVLSASGRLQVFDTDSGELLHESDWGAQDLSFSADKARLTPVWREDRDRLLLFYDEIGRIEPVCLVLDTGSWERVGFYRGPAAFLPESGELLVCPYLDRVYRSPFWTLADMIARAGAVTGDLS